MSESMLAGIGDNSGAVPLEEILADETAALRERAGKLIAASGRAAVTDDDTAGKATELAKMLREHAKTVDKAREDRKAPFLAAGNAVQAHYKAIEAPVLSAFKVVEGMIDAYRREQQRLADIERRRLEAEARALREAAEQKERERLAAEREAQRKIDEAEAEARRAGDRAAAAEAAQRRAVAQAEADRAALDAEVARNQAAEAAAEKQRQAEATVAAPIRSSYGASATGRTTYKGTIVDLTKALRYLVKANRAGLLDAAQVMVDKLVRSGVREIDGVDVVAETSTVIR